MKTYKFEVTITAGNDEWWEALGDDPGIKAVQEWLNDVLVNAGFNVTMALKSFHMDNEIF